MKRIPAVLSLQLHFFTLGSSRSVWSNCVLATALLLASASGAETAFVAVPTGIPPATDSAEWGDHDGDGHLDLLVIGATGAAPNADDIARIYRNNGNGTFSDVEAGLQQSMYGEGKWADFDNDGDLDVLVVGSPWNGPPLSYLYRNDGAGVFVRLNAGLLGVADSDADWGDFDNDGDLDILLAGNAETIGYCARIYRNDRLGGFEESDVNLAGLVHGSVEWGDYDTDGDLDILQTGYDGVSRRTFIWRNDGGASFVDIDAHLTGVVDGDASWGDYDSDGDLDVVLIGQVAEGAVALVYRNDGNDTFVDIAAALHDLGGAHAVWGDCDNDGDLDIVLNGKLNGWFTHVYRNEGNDVFADINAGLLGSDGGLSWGDFDNDGDLDIAGSGLGLYRNDGSATNTIPPSPTVLTATWSAGVATFAWKVAADAETPGAGLTYNLRVGTTPGGQEICSAMADPSTGHRLLPGPGNVEHNLAWSLTLPETVGVFYWTVQALDAAYAGSPFAAEAVLVTTLVADLPAPVNLRACAEGTASVALSWSDVSATELGFVLQRRAGNLGPWLSVASLGADTRSWRDTDLTIGVEYTYRVRAWTAAGASPFSNEASALPFNPAGFLIGTVYRDVDDNDVFDEDTDLQIAGATVAVNATVRTQTDGLGHYVLDAPWGGSWNSITTAAAKYRTSQITAEIAYGTPTLLDLQLDPVLPEDVAVRELIPQPAGFVADIGAGGTLHHYLVTYDRLTDAPLGGVEVAVYRAGQPFGAFVANEHGVVDVWVRAADLPTDGSAAVLNVESLDGLPLALGTQRAFGVRAVPQTVERVYETELGGSLKFLLPKVELMLSSRARFMSLWEPGRPGPTAPTVVAVTRARKRGPYADVDVGTSGFYSKVDGPGEVTGGLSADAGASISLGVYDEKNEEYLFGWPPASVDEAEMLFLMIGDGCIDRFDNALHALLREVAANSDYASRVDTYCRGEGVVLGAEAGCEAIGQLNLTGLWTPTQFRADLGAGIAGGAFVGGNSDRFGQLKTRFCGLTAEYHRGVDLRFGFGAAARMSRYPGVRQLSEYLFAADASSEGATGTVHVYGKYGDTGEMLELGVQSVSEFVTGDEGCKRTRRLFVREPGLLNQLRHDGSSAFHIVDGPMRLGTAFSLDLRNVLNSSVDLGEAAAVAQLGSSAWPDSPETLDQLPLLLYEEDAQDQSDYIGRDLGFSLGIVSAKLHQGTWHGIKSRRERGVQVWGRRYPLEEYGACSDPPYSDYETVMQIIIGSLPQSLLTKAFRVTWLPWAKSAAPAGVERFQLGDGVSYLDLDPLMVPPGLTPGEAYWTWQPAVAQTVGVTSDQLAALATLKKRTETSYGMTYGIGGFHQLEPEGTALLGPGTLTLAYADSEVVGIDESALAVYYEDKNAHRLVYVGGVVDTQANTVTAPIGEFRLYMLAPRQPYGSIVLTPTPQSIVADGVSTVHVTSGPIVSSDGAPALDGELFTVRTSNGTITTPDVDAARVGVQVASSAGTIDFTLRSSEISYGAVIDVTSVRGLAAGTDTIPFMDAAPPNAPTGLSVVAAGINALQMAWSRSEAPDIGGYRVHYDVDGPEPPYGAPGSYLALASPIDVGNDTTITIIGLDLATEHYLTVTAYDISGRESSFATPVVASATTGTPVGDMPGVLTLAQNAPNPFNPRTRITFTVPQTGKVSLMIYDVRGRRVRTLVDEVRSRGAYEVNWHADDDAGRTLASGVYLCVLRNEVGSEVRKMAIVR